MRVSRNRTLPPIGMNLMALESRFQTACCKRSGSTEKELSPRMNTNKLMAQALGGRQVRAHLVAFPVDLIAALISYQARSGLRGVFHSVPWSEGQGDRNESWLHIASKRRARLARKSDSGRQTRRRTRLRFGLGV